MDPMAEKRITAEVTILCDGWLVVQIFALL